MISQAFELPLTSAQQGIWLGQQLKPKSSMYNTAEYLEFKGEFNQGIFEQTATYVLQNTTALNTAFILKNEQPVQVNIERKEALATKMVFLDLSSSLGDDNSVSEHLSLFLKQPLDITKGQNYRHLLLKLASDHFIWALCIHHIATDGYSFAMLATAITDNYKGLLNTGFNSKLPFGDYTQIQDEDEAYKDSKYYIQDINYWRELFETVKTVRSICPVATDISDDHIKSTASIISSEFHIISELAKYHGTSWSDLIVTMVASLIHQYTGLSQTVIGMPISARMGSVAADIPCMTMNIVPVVFDFSNASSQAELLKETSQQINQGRRHFRARYEVLKQNLGRNKDNKKLFAPVVNIIPFERRLYLSGCDISAHTLSAGPVEDLSFTFVKQADDSIKLALYANPKNYSQPLIDALIQDFLISVSNVDMTLSKPLSIDIKRISYVAAAELPRNSFATHSVLTRIYQRAKLAPAEVAIKAHETQITYCQLIDKVSRQAANIWELGIEKQQTVALVIPRSEQAITHMLAVLLLGHRFVFIDPEAPLKRNLLVLQDANPALVIMYPFINNTMREAFLNFHCIDTPALELTNANVDVAHLWLSQERHNHSAYLIYTSGSTGVPKGVEISYSALNDFALAASLDYKIDHNDVVLQFAPLHFDACIEEIFVTLSVGARLVIRNDEMITSPALFLEQCNTWQISVLDLPTAYWHELALATEAQALTLPDSLKTIIIGGEAVQPERILNWRKRFGTQVKLLNTYGPSEATVVATFADLSTDLNANLIGLPLTGRQLAIVDPQLNILPKGETGELLLLGASLSDGYLGLPDKTAECFIDLPLNHRKHNVRAYRTGDKAKIHPCGNVEFLGRIDCQIKISGYRIEPGEIEQAILALSGIKDAVISIYKQQHQQYICAHIISDLKKWQQPELRKALAGSLPAPMLPNKVMMHEHFAKTPAGKIDRNALNQLANTEQVNTIVSHELSEFEQVVAGVWRQVLGINSIAANDDFFLIGGQSLHSIQVANRLSILLKREVPVSLIFNNPTLSGLAKSIDSETSLNQADENNNFILMQQDINTFSRNLNPNKHQTKTDHKVILLTGATGFVGAQLLKYLLDTTQAEIKCVVRANDQQHAMERLIEGFQAQELTGFCPERITPLCLDLASNSLGLTPGEYKLLAQQVDCIFHNAAQTSVVRDYQSLRESNVLPTANLLQLASINGVAFNHISTIAVSSNDTLKEDFVPIHSGLKDGYQQSKWVSEALVEVAQKNNYPVNVYRLARVTGGVSQGFINRKDLVWSIIRSGLNNQVLPDLQVEEPWTPVDTIAKFIVTHGIKQSGKGVFNLTPEHKVQVNQLFTWLKALSFDFELINLPAWCQVIKTQGTEEDQTILSFFEQAKLTDNHDKKIDVSPCINSKFVAQLTELNIQLPHIDKNNFCQYLKYGISHNLVPLPSFDLPLTMKAFLNTENNQTNLSVNQQEAANEF